MNQDKSARYHTLRRRAALASGAWSLLLLALLLATGASLALRDWAERAAASIAPSPVLLPSLVVWLYLVALAAVHEAGALPIAFYRSFLLEHRYGLSTERLRLWLLDQVKGWAVGGLLALAGVGLLYGAIRTWPNGWWVPATVGFLLVVALLARLAPVLLLPIFFRFKPLAREELRRRLVTLSERAGLSVIEVLEWQLSDRTKKGNAALAGLGRTRRILVSDTLLASCSDDEIEAVLAHELAHYVHRDLWLGIAMEGAAAALGFYLASKVLAGASGWLGLSGPWDVAGLPLLLLVAGGLSLVLMPLANAGSRWMERRADRFAFRLTGNPEAFATAIRRLGNQNLAEETPSALVVWLFYSHPPIHERVAAAARWRAAHPA